MDKREHILDSMQQLLSEDKGKSCSVTDIANKAQIAKGGMYYYFRSKEEVFNALVDREYSKTINHCRQLLQDKNLDAMSKLKLLLKNYTANTKNNSVNGFLYQPQNAEIHLKLLKKSLSAVSPMLSDIIEQGVAEGVFVCENTFEVSEIIMSAFCFLLCGGVFTWTQEQELKRRRALADVMEKALAAKKGSMSFIYE